MFVGPSLQYSETTAYQSKASSSNSAAEFTLSKVTQFTKDHFTAISKILKSARTNTSIQFWTAQSCLPSPRSNPTNAVILVKYYTALGQSGFSCQP